MSREKTQKPSPLTCALSEPWMGKHPKCEKEAARMAAEFDRDVFFGKYDAQGYTPNERKALAKRQAVA